MRITRQKSGCCPMSCIPRRNNTLSCWGMVNILIRSNQSLTILDFILLAFELGSSDLYWWTSAPASAVLQQRGATTWGRRIFYVKFGSWFHSNYSTEEHFYIIKIFEGNELLSGRVVTNYWRSYVVWPGGYGFQFDDIGLRVLASPHKEHCP